QPPLRIGIAVDISPSMEPAIRPAAEIAWLLGRLTHARRDTTAATVTWHTTAAALEHPTSRGQLHIPRPAGRSGGLPAAIDALDGKLHYARLDGAKLLCIITDAALPNLPVVQRRVTALHRVGVTVLWITIPIPGKPTNVLEHVTHLPIT